MPRKSSKGRNPSRNPKGNEMPMPGMEEPVPGAEMPAPGMSEPRATAPRSAARGGRTEEPAESSAVLSQSTQGEERFPPRGGAAASPPADAWEPGVVEVQFREGVAPRFSTPRRGGEPPALASRGEADLTPLNQLLARHHLERAEPSITLPPDQPGEVRSLGRERGEAAAEYADYVTLHFPPDTDVRQVAQELQQLPEVERAVPVPRAIPPAVSVSDPLLGSDDQALVDPVTGLENQWYIYRCRAHEAWKLSTGEGVVLANIDYGYRLDHQDLVDRLDLTHAHNSWDGSTNVSAGDQTYHGTGVMGLAGAAANGLGVAGFAFGASLWPIQANTGAGPFVGGSPFANAVEWVRRADSGGRRKVINLEVQSASYGNFEQLPALNAAIRAAIADGVVVCVTAGNGDRDAGLDDLGNPFSETGSILVGATAYDPVVNRRAWFSNWGSRIVVSAPGDGAHDVTVDASAPNAYRNNFGGTSGAAPKVAGTVALMLAANPSLSHHEVREILRATGGLVASEPGKPAGTFLNTEAAVREAIRWMPATLEVFATASDAALWHRRQMASGSWTDWESLGGWLDRLASGRNADGRLEVFGRSTDGGLRHIWQLAPGGAWSDWEPLGGGWIDLLSVAQNADGCLEVFARAADRAVWRIRQLSAGGAWSSWESLGGSVTLLAVERTAAGLLDVFARGADGAVWHKRQAGVAGGWCPWESLGGRIDMLAVGRNQDGRIEVFARGMEGALWHRWETAEGVWSRWDSLGGWIDRLAVGHHADGRLEAFVRSSDKAVWHKGQTAANGTWGEWKRLGGWIDRLEVVKNNDGRLELFARGAEKALWHNAQVAPNGAWGGWASLGGWVDLLAVGR